MNREDVYDAWVADRWGAADEFIEYLIRADWNDPDTVTSFDEWLDTPDAEQAFNHHYDALKDIY